MKTKTFKMPVLFILGIGLFFYSCTSSDDNSNINENLSNKEEHIPKLFSDEGQNQSHHEDEISEEANANHTEKLFEQDLNEEEDFEIPAFLRKQKF